MSASDTNFEDGDVPGYTNGMESFGALRVYNDQVLLGSGTGSVEERSRRASERFGIEISNPSKFFELSRDGEIERGPVLLSKLQVPPADLLDIVTLLNFAVAALVNDDDAEVDYNAWSGVDAMSNPDVLTGWTEVVLNYLSNDADNSMADTEESRSKAPGTVDSDRPSTTAGGSRTAGHAPRQARRRFPNALPRLSSDAASSRAPDPESWPIDSPTQDVQTRAGVSSAFDTEAANTSFPIEDARTPLDRHIEKFIASYTTSFRAFQQNPQAQPTSSPAQIAPEVMSAQLANVDRLMAQLRSSQEEVTGAAPSVGGTIEDDEHSERRA
ncbi:hypothetical protein EHS25_001626 [Saitozyma podzolica]|uniref:Uncharacterized protein n=1 Tax=Saitozyma podzolica TaxID=1890683 RepID=A0A427YGT2_9TREE|nr:hypothetical protein EHS25_001626 [Saitozyma podzolica]